MKWVVAVPLIFLLIVSISHGEESTKFTIDDEKKEIDNLSEYL